LEKLQRAAVSKVGGFLAMSKQIKKATSDRYSSRMYRKARVRKKLSGTPECPRMNVFKSNSHFNIQIIDDDSGSTIVQCSTIGKGT
jgi:ribosomal protein L18